MSVNKLRLGVLGCGGHAVNHLKHLPQNVEVVALCDTSMEAMVCAGEAILNAPVAFKDPQQFFMFSPVEAVFIATPDRFHAEQGFTALEAGKHVLVEKPLATDELQRKLVEHATYLASNRNLIYLTCHPRRFDPRNEWIKATMPLLVAHLGKPKKMFFTFQYPAPSDWKNSRGLLMDHVNHEIDLMGYLLGFADFSVVTVKDSPVAYRVVGERVDGVSFSFSGTRSPNVPNWDKSEETLQIFFEGDEKLEVRNHDPVVRVWKNPKPSDEYTIPSRGHHFERYRDVMQNFTDVVRGVAKPYVSIEEMLVNTAAGVYLTTRGGYNSAVDGK